MPLYEEMNYIKPFSRGSFLSRVTTETTRGVIPLIIYDDVKTIHSCRSNGDIYIINESDICF